MWGLSLDVSVRPLSERVEPLLDRRDLRKNSICLRVKGNIDIELKVVVSDVDAAELARHAHPRAARLVCQQFRVASDGRELIGAHHSYAGRVSEVIDKG